jgi:hypothetical protein
MNKYFRQNRRSFLKGSAASAASIALAGAMKDAMAKQAKVTVDSGWTEGMMINPSIPNGRIAYITDMDMVENTAPNWDYHLRDQALNRQLVMDNMDKMALALAQPDSGLVQDAWDTIFQKPDEKEWADVTVGFTTNTAFGGMSGNLVIIQKLAEELNRLGVPGGNMTFFDGGGVSDGNINKYNNDGYGESVMPSGFIFDGGRPGGVKWIETPEPWTNGCDCCGDVADGNFDIYIQLPICGGHGEFGFTQAMKLAYAWMQWGANDHGANTTGRLNQVDCQVAIHQSQQIIGGSVPRMQLSILDSLWIRRDGPGGNPHHVGGTLCMSTLAPVVDIWSVLNIRENMDLLEGQPLTGTYEPDHAVLDKYLDLYGMTYDDIVDVDASSWEPGEVSAKKSRKLSDQRAVNVKVSFGTYSTPRTLNFYLEKTARQPEISVYDMRGQFIRNIRYDRTDPNNISVNWDGMNDNGLKVQPGTYAVKIKAGKKLMALKVSIL